MRSRAYPSNDLGTAINRLHLYNKNLGTVGQHSRDEIAIAIGYKGMSGPASRAIASLVQYGLLERRKDKYGITDLARSVLLPQNDGETESALQEASVKPTLFGEIARQYQGQELPSLLGNILTSPQFGISPKVKDEVVEVFKASMEYAGLLRNNRIQPLDIPHDVADSQAVDELGSTAGDSQNINDTNSSPANGQGTQVSGGLTKLPSGISIAFPANLGYAVITGEFSEEIKDLENKAQTLLAETKRTNGDEEERQL